MKPDMTKVPTSYESPRLLLRRYEPAQDAQLFFDTIQQNREHLAESAPDFVLAFDRAEQARELLERFHQDWREANRFLIGVWEKATGQFVAEIYLGDTDWRIPKLEIGYYVTHAALRRGIATEAVQATAIFVFEQLGVRKLNLCCDDDNIASGKVAERAGFVQEGLIRDGAAKKDGTVVDERCYGMTRTDFQRMKDGLLFTHE